MKFIFTTALFCMLLMFGRTTLVAQTIALSISGANTGTWTAPTTGGPYFVRITARGGDGGTGAENASVFAAGGGATLSGIFEVQAGQTIRAISGAKGQSSVPAPWDNGGGGGGGAGAVNLTTNSFLLIAGGGNGAAQSKAQSALATAGNGNGGASYDLLGGGGGGGINAPGGNQDNGGGGGGQVSMTDLSGGGFSGGGGSGVGGSGMGGGGGGSYFTSNDGGGGGGQTGGSAEVPYPTRSLPGGLCQSNTSGQLTLTPQDGYVKVELLSTLTYYKDSDSDGFGDPAQTTPGPEGCAPAGYASNSNDCNDNDPAIHEPQAYYADKDGDGFGDPGSPTPACSLTPPQGSVKDNTDCDDTQTFYQDNDGDGFGSNVKVACGGVTNNQDCNDNQVLYQDTDADGYGSSVKVACGGVTNNQDCNDGDARINPATIWVLDGDGDGYYAGNPVIQCSSPGSGYVLKSTQMAGDCNDADVTINPATIWVLDADGDGYYFGNPVTQCVLPGAGYVIKTTQQAGDCLDNNKNVNPGAPEICGNGVDDNCNGQVDEGCATITLYILPSLTKEGNSGKQTMIFTLLLNKPATGNLSVVYKTMDGSAQAGSDYQAATGIVSFSKGQVLKFITVQVYGDKKAEYNEQFYTQLSNPIGMKIYGTGKASGTILNDDGGSISAKTAADEKVVTEIPTLVVPNLLHRNEAWRIPNLPAQNEVIVTDMNGRVVLKGHNYQNGRSFSSSASGMYLYQIQIRDIDGKAQLHTGKLMIVE